MLRHKLLLILFSLTALLMALAVAAFWSLPQIIGGLDHVQTRASAVVEDVNELNAAIYGIKAQLYEMGSGRAWSRDRLAVSAKTARRVWDRLTTDCLLHTEDADASIQHVPPTSFLW